MWFVLGISVYPGYGDNKCIGQKEAAFTTIFFLIPLSNTKDLPFVFLDILPLPTGILKSSKRRSRRSLKSKLALSEHPSRVRPKPHQA